MMGMFFALCLLGFSAAVPGFIAWRRNQQLEKELKEFKMDWHKQSIMELDNLIFAIKNLAELEERVDKHLEKE